MIIDKNLQLDCRIKRTSDILTPFTYFVAKTLRGETVYYTDVAYGFCNLDECPKGILIDVNDCPYSNYRFKIRNERQIIDAQFIIPERWLQ